MDIAAAEPPEPPAPAEAGEGLAALLARHLADRRRLEAAIEDLTARLGTLAPTRTIGRPRSNGPAQALVGVLGAAVLAGLVYLSLGTRLATLEGDLEASLERSEGLVVEVRAARAAVLRERESERQSVAERIRGLEGDRDRVQQEAAAVRAELEGRLGALEERLVAEKARSEERAGRIESLALDLDRMRRAAAMAAGPAPAAPRELEPAPARAEVPPPQPGPPTEPPLTRVDRLNSLLARADGSRIYRVLSAFDLPSGEGGALRDAVVKVLSSEGEVVEEVRAARLDVELSRSTRRAVLSFHECERRFRKGDREESTRLPWFQVELFDVDLEAWARELEGIVRWAE